MLTEKELDLNLYIESHKKEESITRDRVAQGIRQLLDLRYSDESALRKRQFTDRVCEAKFKLFCQYIASKISQEFPLLDNSLFTTERAIKVQNIQGEFTLVEDYLEPPKEQKKQEGKIYTRYINIPLLVSCDLDENQAFIGHFDLPGKKSQHACLTAPLPAAMPIEIYKLQIKSSKIINNAIADLLDDEITALEIVRNGLRDFYRTDYRIYWIPTLEELKPKDIQPKPRDPILVMNAVGRRFLIGEWDEPNNSPLKAVLEEFKLT